MSALPLKADIGALDLGESGPSLSGVYVGAAGRRYCVIDPRGESFVLKQLPHRRVVAGLLPRFSHRRAAARVPTS